MNYFSKYDLFATTDYFQQCNEMLTVQYIGIYWHGSLNMDINGRCTARSLNMGYY